MASITKTAKGWRAQVYVKGVRESQCYPTKAQATAWASERETQLRNGAKTGARPDKTVQDLFDKYADEVSILKRGAEKEIIRLRYYSNYQLSGKRLGDYKLKEVTPELLGRVRNERLKEIAASSFNRDMNLLSNVFNVARKEWKWISESPTKDVKRPKESEHRKRLISQQELDKLAISFGYQGEVKTLTHVVYVALLFAIETAMRAGEICGLEWRHIKGKIAHLPITKNGAKRDVSLSNEAQRLLNLLPNGKPSSKAFGLTPSRLDALWRKYRDKTDIEDLHFHDSRHEAITRLSKKLNVLELARMVGHKDLNELNTYYNESAETIADRLN